MVKYLLDKQGRFIVEDYNKAYPFSNFLPAIGGLWGIPLWAFYVNRAQAMISCGIKDKNHSILEFFPADRAYQVVSSLGFRTFIKVDKSSYYEPYRLGLGYPKKERLLITSFDLTIEEDNRYLGLSFWVNYFTLPNMPFASLVRTLRIRNNTRRRKRLEIIDGVPRIIPFGSREIFIKHLSRTLEAWMYSQIKNIDSKKIALFKLTVNPKDTSSTQYIEGANFSYSFYNQEGKVGQPQILMDPTIIFAEDASFNLPLKFLKKNFKFTSIDILRGKTPCCFSYLKAKLGPQKEVIIYTLIGAVFRTETLKGYLAKVNPTFLDRKKEENKRIIEEIKNSALCVSGLPEFDQYIKNSYLDNTLRGGFPYKFDNGRVYYLFSRKHGDLERDYNRFKLLPSYFSEGECNYRDVNQNRRMDLFFNPAIYDRNIIYFMNLLRMDSYNPLLVRGQKLFFEDEGKIKETLKSCKIPLDSEIIALMKKGFYLGQIFNLLEAKKIKLKEKNKFINLIFERAQSEPQAKFGEGFWIDHWHYNLDLIDGFLYFYPDKRDELFLKEEFMFWDDEFRVKERSRRYIIKSNKVYQLNSVEEVLNKKEEIFSRKRFKNFLRVEKGKGPVYKTNLVEKLLTLILNRVATLDFAGIGVEMEADRPGWCDSLNGLPALFGSSVCETLELKRAVILLREAIEVLEKDKKEIRVCGEVIEFFTRLEKLIQDYFKLNKANRDFIWWEEANRIKEDFREKVFWGLQGTKKILNLSRVKDFLDRVVVKLDKGIKKALDKKTGLYYSYFMYDIKEYQEEDSSRLKLKRAKRYPLPLFLEAPVHILRVNKELGIHNKLKKTPLFDKRIKMYRLNTSLANTTLQIGRSRVFPPGWLENESIWLHMEYKYLLELLKNGLYDEFYKNLFNCAICFQDPKIYGRSILENSSFIVSSAHRDRSLWGKGFVARLTGATSEIINMWILMCLGKRPFFVNERNQLYLRLSPILKAEFFTRKPTHLNINGEKKILPSNTFAFKLFSSVLVVYLNPKRKDTYSKEIRIERIEIYEGHKKTILRQPLIPPPLSYKIREAEVDQINIYFS
jgi:hypothetical protein